MHKPAKTDGIERSPALAEAREGLCVDASDAAELDRALDLAVNYRGDVTLRLRSGDVVCGYVYDRTRSDRPGAARVRILPPDGPRRSIPLGEIAAIEFTGRDTASGRSFETWMKKYVRKRRAGEPAEMEDRSAAE